MSRDETKEGRVEVVTCFEPFDLRCNYCIREFTIMLGIVLVILSVRFVLGFGVGFHLTQVARSIPNHDSFTKAGSLFLESVLQFDKLEVDWDVFLQDGVQLWQEKYGTGNDDHGLKQFILGVSVGNKINSLQNYTDHGVVNILANLEFGGSIEDTLRYLRGSADLVHLSLLLGQDNIEWNYYLSTQIKLPLKEDVLDLLSQQNIEGDWVSIVGHMFDMLGVLHSELYLLQNKRFHALDVAYSLSPGGPKLLREHWRGGEWNILAELQKFTYGIGLQFNVQQSSEKSSLSITTQDSNSDNKYVTPLKKLSLFGTSIVSGEFLEDVPCIAVGAPLDDVSGSIYVIPMSTLESEGKQSSKMTALYGSKVHKFRLSNYDYLVVSEPGKKSIHIYLFGEKIITIVDPSSSYQEVSCIVDLDNDQIPDLILTCKYCNKNELGKVIIIPGLNIIPYLVSGKINQVEFVDNIGSIVLNGPRSLKFQHYGANAAASGSFLFVTAQSLGLVYGYNLQQLNTGIPPSFYIKEDDIIFPSEDVPWKWGDIIASSEHGFFGAEMHVWTHDQVDYIAISQLLFNKVYIFKDAGNSALEVWLILELDTLVDLNTVKSSIEFGKGVHFSHSRKRLFLSSPGSFNGAGAIWSVSMSEMKRTVELWRSKHLLITALKHLEFVNPEQKKKGWSNFGSNLAESPLDDLLVSIPQFGYGDLHDLSLIGALLIH